MAQLVLEKQFFIPTIKWYQTKEYITLNVEVYDSKNEIIKIMSDSISFYAESKENVYKMDFNLYSNIEMKESKYSVNDKSIKIILKKTLQENWSYLLKDRNSYKNNIKIDWNEWINDMDDEVEESNQFNFEQMMQNMKGMEGEFPQNNNVNEECEDDDEYDDNEYCDHNTNCENEDCEGCENNNLDEDDENADSIL